jgi:hypothetical protein
VKPDPRKSKDFTIHDPAAGTGGFLMCAYEWLIEETKGRLDRDDVKRIVPKIEELLPKVNEVRERLTRVKAIMKRFRPSSPLPPLDEQKEIVRRVASLFNLVTGDKKRIEAELSRTEKMTQAILAKAFRGEPVSTAAELGRREAVNRGQIACRRHATQRACSVDIPTLLAYDPFS